MNQPNEIWRSLDELAGTPEFREFTAKEFPGFANVYESLGEAEVVEKEGDGLNRRQFVALSAAALGLAGLSGCRRPDLKILPYSQTPENVVPGVPTFYATSMPKSGGCFPILVENHEGRPTKIEGNPKHPASLGGTDAQTQASILDLYSPDRSKQVLKKDADGKLAPKSWEEFDAFAAEHFADLRKNEGEGLRFLIEDNPSPALRFLREQMKEKYPKAVWHRYEPLDRERSLEGTKLVFGQPLQASFNLAKAFRIVSLDCDFLGLDGNEVANARGFAELRRNPQVRAVTPTGVVSPTRKRGPGEKENHAYHGHDSSADVNRLYVLENTYTVTGTMADHRLRLPAAHIVDYALALCKEIAAIKGLALPAEIKSALEKVAAPEFAIPESWIKEVAADMAAFKGKGLVLAGSRQPALVHAVCACINEALGNTGVTVAYRPIVAEEYQSIAELAAAIDKVKTLVIVGGNPVYNAWADLKLADSIAAIPMVIRLGQFVDETSESAAWHLPQAHYLESWGDAETADGTYSSIQPLIAPLHGGRSFLEFLIQISGWDKASGYADAKAKVYKLLQESFKKRTGKEDDLAFKQFLHEGFVAGSSRAPVKPTFAPEAVAKAIGSRQASKAVSASNYEISIHPDYSLLDGRFAWNGWLLELPDPLTKLVWDNAALVGPETARTLKVKQGDVLEIEANGVKIKVPAFILPGQAEASISLTLGYGKLRLGRVAGGGGFDVYPIRTTKAPWFTTGNVIKTPEFYELVTTQEHGTIPKDKDEDIIQEFTLEEFGKRLVSPTRERGSDVSPTHENGHEASESTPHEKHEDSPKSRFQWGYDRSAYKGAGPEMKEIKRIALETAEDVSFPQRLDGHMQWGMVIDLNTCTGCSACMIACQAENNVPIVGKGEVKRNREMHWISLHRYFMTKKDEVKAGLESPPADDPRIVAQPMMCQHCEAAPCESVCPVNAAVHSPEGLNLQVYNRCIGTRYCSNNCPYKARRFNWFDFNKRRIDELRVPTPFSEAGTPETLKMQKNPEVTVRMRGVMEKCTYCVQRIEKGKIGAKVLAIKAGADKSDAQAPADPFRAGYDIRTYDGASRVIVPDGIITPACAQACPTQSIVFGNVRDPKSRVHQLKNLEGGPDYLVLGTLNTKPRTSYLPRLRNPNPKMIAKEAHA